MSCLYRWSARRGHCCPWRVRCRCRKATSTRDPWGIWTMDAPHVREITPSCSQPESPLKTTVSRLMAGVGLCRLRLPSDIPAQMQNGILAKITLAKFGIVYFWCHPVHMGNGIADDLVTGRYGYPRQMNSIPLRIADLLAYAFVHDLLSHIRHQWQSRHRGICHRGEGPPDTRPSPGPLSCVSEVLLLVSLRILYQAN